MYYDLALDIDATEGLKTSNTDIQKDWNTTTAKNEGINPSGSYGTSDIIAPYTTERTVPQKQEQPSQVATRSWDFGQWVLAEPLATSVMGTDGSTGVGPSCGDVNDVAKCQKVGFVKVGSNDGTLSSPSTAVLRQRRGKPTKR